MATHETGRWENGSCRTNFGKIFHDLRLLHSKWWLSLNCPYSLFHLHSKRHKISLLNTAQHLYPRSRRPEALFQSFCATFYQIVNFGKVQFIKNLNKIRKYEKKPRLRQIRNFIKDFMVSQYMSKSFGGTYKNLPSF